MLLICSNSCFEFGSEIMPSIQFIKIWPGQQSLKNGSRNGKDSSVDCHWFCQTNGFRSII
jgi:hypothetical protein